MGFGDYNQELGNSEWSGTGEERACAFPAFMLKYKVEARGRMRTSGRGWSAHADPGGASVGHVLPS